MKKLLLLLMLVGTTNAADVVTHKGKYLGQAIDIDNSAAREGSNHNQTITLVTPQNYTAKMVQHLGYPTAWSNQPQIVYFENQDCTGRRWVRLPPNTVFNLSTTLDVSEFYWPIEYGSWGLFMTGNHADLSLQYCSYGYLDYVGRGETETGLKCFPSGRYSFDDYWEETCRSMTKEWRSFGKNDPAITGVPNARQGRLLIKHGN